MNQRDQALETAARMIDKRVDGLKKELARDEERGSPCVPSDRACILEAEYIARQIRGLIGHRLKPLANTDNSVGCSG